jgi:hypothetical protein
LRRPDGGGVAAGPAANNYEVEVVQLPAFVSLLASICNFNCGNPYRLSDYPAVYEGSQRERTL